MDAHLISYTSVFTLLQKQINLNHLRDKGNAHFLTLFPDFCSAWGWARRNLQPGALYQTLLLVLEIHWLALSPLPPRVQCVLAGYRNR